MWVVVYVAESRGEGEHLKELLAEEGILATLRSLGAAAATSPVEILVAEAEAEEAHEILAARMGR